MLDSTWTIWDTALLQTTVNSQTLFQVARSGDAVHTPDFTNMRAAGQFPTQESFLIERVGLMLDENINVDEVQDWAYKSHLEIFYNNVSLAQFTAGECVYNNDYGGHFTFAAAGDEALIGRSGKGRELAIPLMIDGGIPFSVVFNQASTVTTANSELKCMLFGTLTRKNLSI